MKISKHVKHSHPIKLQIECHLPTIVNRQKKISLVSFCFLNLSLYSVLSFLRILFLFFLTTHVQRKAWLYDHFSSVRGDSIIVLFLFKKYASNWCVLKSDDFSSSGEIKLFFFYFDYFNIIYVSIFAMFFQIVYTCLTRLETYVYSHVFF